MIECPNLRFNARRDKPIFYLRATLAGFCELPRYLVADQTTISILLFALSAVFASQPSNDDQSWNSIVKRPRISVVGLPRVATARRLLCHTASCTSS